MDKRGGMKIISLFLVLSLLVAILPIYSLDRPEKYIKSIEGESIGFKTYSIDTDNIEYAVLEIEGKGTETYQNTVIKQENAENYRDPGTQTFTCNGEVTGIEVYILPPGGYVRLTGIFPPPTPPTANLKLYIKDLQNNVLFQSDFSVTATFKPMPIWKSITVPNLNLNGKYKLQLVNNSSYRVSWYYGSGYNGGRANFNSNKDFCFRIHCKEKTTLYPKEVKYKTDLMDSYEIISTDLGNGKVAIKIPEEKINGATEILLSSWNGNALTEISWRLTLYRKVPETKAELSLPIPEIEGENMRFKIIYTDINNDPPVSAKIYINNVEYDLTNSDDDEYQWNGSLYTITLPYQECNYYFIFNNGKETIRMPEEDSFHIGELEKKISEWKENTEKETQLMDQELQKIDLYYIQENYDPQILKDLLNIKIEQIRNTAVNYRLMKNIHHLASQREEIMAFENLSNEDLDDAFTEIQNGFPEEIKEIFRNYGMTEENIEKLRNDILENRETIKEKRILSNFVDLKENYLKIALLNIQSFSNTSYHYFEKYDYVYNPLPEKKQIVLNAWNIMNDLNPDMDIMKTNSLEIIQNGITLVENGNFQYLDDINAALVYYFIAETGDPELIQELASHYEIYNHSCNCEKTLQDLYNYAKTVKFNTVNGRDTIDNIKIIIRPPGVDYPLMPIKKLPEHTPVISPCTKCKILIFSINGTIEGQTDEEIFMDVPIDCDGVPDSDNDGWCDTIDPCPNTPGVNCEKSDIDHDGIPDDEDDCPNDPGISYYHGCPAPGEEDTDGDGVIDTYDHCPNQAGPASNNGCPLPEDCLCKDREDVKKLLDALEVQEDLIQQGEKLIEEKKKDLKKEKEDLEYWKYHFIAEFKPDSSRWWISLIGGGILLSIHDGFKGGTFSIKDCGKSFVYGSIYMKLGLLDAYTFAYGYNTVEINQIQNTIQHQMQIKEWHQKKAEKIRAQLREKCPCVLEAIE